MRHIYITVLPLWQRRCCSDDQYHEKRSGYQQDIDDSEHEKTSLSFLKIGKRRACFRCPMLLAQSCAPWAGD